VLTFAEWLSGTAPSVAIQSTFWLIRLLQATHLLCAGITAVSGIMIALRVLGLQRADEPFEAVWARFAPWLAWSFAFMLATGLAQTLGDPVRELTATSYWVKLALAAACALGTLWLARAARLARGPAAPPPFAAKLAAAALVLSWLALPWLGRMIAYDLAFWGELSLRT
jgi:hypothetical protein